VWIDALFHKVRDGGRVVSVATVIASAVKPTATARSS
jgi:transposase-like protein